MIFLSFPTNFRGLGEIWVAECISPVPLALPGNWKRLTTCRAGTGGSPAINGGPGPNGAQLGVDGDFQQLMYSIWHTTQLTQLCEPPPNAVNIMITRCPTRHKTCQPIHAQVGRWGQKATRVWQVCQRGPLQPFSFEGNKLPDDVCHGEGFLKVMGNTMHHSIIHA